MLRGILFATATLFAAAQAQATTVSYTDWTYNTDDQVDWVVTIEEATQDVYGKEIDIFHFTVDIADDDLVGDIIGFGFNTDINYGLLIQDDIISYSDSPDFGFCSGSCNWSGTEVGRLPDYSFSVGRNGTRGGRDDHQSFSFGLKSWGHELQADTFSLVAIRATSVGEEDGSREESVKDYSSEGMIEVESVPELNGSLASIMFALMASVMGLARRRQNG